MADEAPPENDKTEAAPAGDENDADGEEFDGEENEFEGAEEADTETAEGEGDDDDDEDDVATPARPGADDDDEWEKIYYLRSYNDAANRIRQQEASRGSNT